ncbi:MAG: carbonate dehydratase [Betaproteobacteria bacterium]|nr:carbonate dehydratase [Betaproteobacteria bacterium]
MDHLKPLFENNERWAADTARADPTFFARLSHLQSPQYLWIGCSDSRVPANQITGLQPGEVFVHRNVANVVVHTDFNCLSVMQYAVEVLRTRHLIVCGHYGCGGVRAALAGQQLGLIDNWLRHIQDVRDRHAELLAALPDDQARWDCLCELNVIAQVRNVVNTTIVRDAWSRGQELVVHGWIYGLKDGRLKDLDVAIAGAQEKDAVHGAATAALHRRWGGS